MLTSFVKAQQLAYQIHFRTKVLSSIVNWLSTEKSPPPLKGLLSVSPLLKDCYPDPLLKDCYSDPPLGGLLPGSSLLKDCYPDPSTLP